jgi:Zn-dependent M28 family amino/carboxypeptidase
MRSRIALGIIGVLFSAARASGAPTRAETEAAKAITADRIRGHIRFLASDLLEGRGTGARGDELAAAYAASVLETLGAKPAAPDGGWFQRFDLIGSSGHPDVLTFQANQSKLPLAFSSDFMAVAGKQKPASKISDAEVVFVGYGIVAPEFQWDDYKKADLSGKVLLMMNNDPDWSPDLFQGTARMWYGRWDYKYEIAAKKGAVGALIIHTTPSAGYPWQVVQTSWSGVQFGLPQGAEPHVEVRGWVTEDAARNLAKLGGKDLDALRERAKSRDFEPVPLGVRVSTSFESNLEKVQTMNVLGSIRGSDPKLASEAVVFSAHHDHLGIRQAKKSDPDMIYNGAVDNASGVAAVLAIAQAFSVLPKAPKRTILFALVAAEEQGLLGSEYLVQHLPIAADKLAADINIDGINILGKTKDVSMIGFGKSDLDSAVTRLVAWQGRVLSPDHFADRGFFYRSDQFNFAKIGVPAAYTHGGLDFVGRPSGWGKIEREKWESTHYHQPSDELTADWNFDGALDDVRLMFFLGVDVANAHAMPKWNKGDEFEARRTPSPPG